MTTATPFIPLVTVDFHTENGLYSAHGGMQPTDDLVSVTTSKTLSDPVGTWQATFTYKRGADGQTWFDRISPMDVAVIRMGRPTYPWLMQNPKIKQDTVMVGIVDEVHKTITMSADGQPQRRVMVRGRDFAKVLVEAQLEFYPSLQGQTADNFVLTQDGWVAMLEYFIGNSIENGTPSQMIGQVMRKIMPKLMQFDVPFWDADRGKMTINSSNVMRFRLGASPFLQPFLMTLQNYTGSIWNLLQQVSEAPFNELFMDTMPQANYNGMIQTVDTDSYDMGFSPTWGDDGAKVILMLRQTPFDTALWKALPTYQITDPEVMNIELFKTDAEAYSLFFAGESLSIPTQTDIKKVAPPVFIEAKAKKFGIKPLEVQIQGISTIDGQDQQAILASQKLSAKLATWHGNNENLLSGSMTIRGRGDIKVGTKGVWLPTHDKKEDPIEFYIEGVSQTYVYNTELDMGTFQTSIEFTRGTDALITTS